jgi:hypothetical protein
MADITSPTLRQLRLQNLRCYSDHTITFENHTVVVGRNNAGKSTLVEALLLVSLVVRKRSRTFVSAPPWLGLSRFRRCIPVSVEQLGLNLKTAFHRYSTPPAIITARFSGDVTVDTYVGREDKVYATVEARQGWIESPYRFAQLELPPVYALPQLGPLRLEEKTLSSERVKEWMYSRLSSLHFRNQLRLMPEYFGDFKNLAESTWHGLRVERVSDSENDQGVPTLSLMLRDGDFTAEVGWMGHGLQVWLQTMWFLAQAPSNATVILDEPDVYLHPDLQRKLFRLMKAKFHQTIVATHSIEIMAEAEPSEILVVDRNKKRSAYANSEPAVQRLIEHVGGIHNIHLARLWNARRFILVEGKDMSFLRHFHSLLWPDSEAPLDSIPNIPIGGWGGWSYAVGSSMIIKNSVGEEVTPYCILDSDYHAPEEIKNRLDEAKSKGIQLHVWQKKEIENYLLSPKVLRRVIAARRAAGMDSPSTGAIEQELLTIANDLKEDTVEGLADCYLAMDRRLGAGGAIRRAREQLRSRWEDPNLRLASVSGKEVLARMSSWSQQQFGTSFGPAAVSKEFRKSDVPQEMVEVLSAIEEHELFKT